MVKKLVWFESYTTICKYYAELTDEEENFLKKMRTDFMKKWILEEIKI